MLAIHFCRFGIPQELHSDQGRNFESTLVSTLCNAFGIKKTRTFAYHPQAEGLVERSNRKLLDILRSYIQREDDWEKYLPFMLYAYNTSIYSSTDTLPFKLMYGREPRLPGGSHKLVHDTVSYEHQLLEKIRKYNQIVEEYISAASNSQNRWYDNNATRTVSFGVGVPVWLSISVVNCNLDGKEGGQ